LLSTLSSIFVAKLPRFALTTTNHLYNTHIFIGCVPDSTLPTFRKIGPLTTYGSIGLPVLGFPPAERYPYARGLFTPISVPDNARRFQNSSFVLPDVSHALPALSN